MSDFYSGTAINPYEGLDDETAQAILDIEIADLVEAEARAKLSKQGTAASDGDAVIAVSLLRRNLEEVRRNISDRRMTQSIAAAVVTDGPLVSSRAQQEETARRDREMARQLQNGRQAQPTSSAPPLPEVNDAFLSKLAGLYVSETAGRALMHPEVPREERDKATGAILPQRTRHQCCACQDTKSYFDVIKAPCGDEYCRDCLRELFEASYTDETLFPPRCCRQTIPIDNPEIILALGKALTAKYESRRIEVETKDRTYCTICSTFIPPTAIHDKSAQCPACSFYTCSTCKHAAHRGPCPDDPGDEQVLELARQEGWQRCNNCNRVIELNHGCFHMTCNCRAEFCYLCALPWKTCTCPQWHDDRLLARANVIVNRENQNLQQGERREALVQRAMENLRENHECAHPGRWAYIAGRHECEHCNHVLPQFILRCRICRLQACARCRRNRF